MAKVKEQLPSFRDKGVAADYPYLARSRLFHREQVVEMLSWCEENCPRSIAFSTGWRPVSQQHKEAVKVRLLALEKAIGVGRDTAMPMHVRFSTKEAALKFMILWG